MRHCLHRYKSISVRYYWIRLIFHHKIRGENKHRAQLLQWPEFHSNWQYLYIDYVTIFRNKHILHSKFYITKHVYLLTNACIKLNYTHISSARDFLQYVLIIIVCMLLTWKGNRILINIFIQHNKNRSVLEDYFDISNIVTIYERKIY
jgi:hypothetical protein